MKHRCESRFRAIWRNFPRSIEIHRNSMDRYIGEKKKEEKSEKKSFERVRAFSAHFVEINCDTLHISETVECNSIPRLCICYIRKSA